jgi:hypothetical protein
MVMVGTSLGEPDDLTQIGACSPAAVVVSSVH